MIFPQILDIFKSVYRSDANEDLASKLLMTAWSYLLVVFIQSQFFPAPYGKFDRTNPIGLLDRLRRLSLPAKISWFAMEVPSFLISLTAILHLIILGDYVRLFLLLPFTIHYLNRSIIYPLTLKNGKPFPVISSGSAFVFTLWNGLMQSHFIVNILDVESISLVMSFSGIIIFSYGMFINIQSDNILKSLRKEKDTGYVIPHGGYYTYVSCPNYFGEFLEWFGFSLYSQTWASVWFCIFTLIFLGLRALATHTWYQEKFKEYPPSRKAFIPFFL